MRVEAKLQIAILCTMASTNVSPASDPISVIPPPQGNWVGSNQGFGFAGKSDTIYARYAMKNEGMSYLAAYASDGKKLSFLEFKSGRRGGFGDPHAGVLLDKNGEWIGICSDEEIKYLSASRHIAPERVPLGRLGKTPDPGHLLSAIGNGEFLSASVGNEGFFSISRWQLNPKPACKNLLTATEADIGGTVSSISLCGTSQCFARATDDSTAEGGVRLLTAWNLKHDKPTKIIQPMDICATCLCIQNSGNRIVAGFGDGSILWYDIKSWEKREVVKSKPLSTGLLTVSGLDVHPTGRYLACVTYDKQNFPNLFTISIEAGEVLSKVTVDKFAQMAVAFNESGTKLATFGADGTIRVYDARPLLKLNKQ